MEIGDGRKRRWTGLALYVLLYLAVALLLVGVFLRLSVPLAVAAGTVAFMVGYMLLMGWVAEGRLDRRD
jgi:hypothetical protein